MRLFRTLATLAMLMPSFWAASAFAGTQTTYDIAQYDPAGEIDYSQQNSAPDNGNDNASLYAKYTLLEEQNRQLRGDVEQLQFRLDQLNTRLQQLEARQAGIAAPSASNAAPTEAPAPTAASAPSASTNTPTPAPAAPAAQNTAPLDTNPAAQPIYDAAFAELKNMKYAAARAAFKKFIAQFPKHQLTPDAMFWVAETLYNQQKKEEASVQFLEIYNQFPGSPRASESLLRLGSLLVEMQKPEQACTLLKKIPTEYPNTSASIQERAQVEMAKAGC